MAVAGRRPSPPAPIDKLRAGPLPEGEGETRGKGGGCRGLKTPTYMCVVTDTGARGGRAGARWRAHACAGLLRVGAEVLRHDFDEEVGVDEGVYVIPGDTGAGG